MKFRDIPTELWPQILKIQHIDHKKVYRAVRNNKNISSSDFLPTSIQRKSRNFLKKLSNYSVSLFCDKIELIKTINSIPSMPNEIVVGFTTIERGISDKANNKTHVNYFLYDYIHNNPFTDFTSEENNDET